MTPQLPTACPTRSSRSIPRWCCSRSSADATATIDYLDVNAQPQQAARAHLPWSFKITTTQAAVLGSVVAQGDGDVLGCRITVKGEVKDQRTTNTPTAYTYCLEKSG